MTNTTLPSFERSSPRTLQPSSSDKLPSIFNTTINLMQTGENGKQKQIVAPSHFVKKTQIIADPIAISNYLENDSFKQSAIGIGDVGSWSNSRSEDAKNVRAAIVNHANEPIVEPKDEWDICLDSGTAYPHKARSKSNPFKDFDRNSYKNEFQSVQQSEGSSRRRMKVNKKKGSVHNKNRFHRRRQKNSVNAMEA